MAGDRAATEDDGERGGEVIGYWQVGRASDGKELSAATALDAIEELSELTEASLHGTVVDAGRAVLATVYCDGKRVTLPVLALSFPLATDPVDDDGGE